MKLLKNGILFSLLIVGVGLSSCSSEECVAPGLSQNIIGTWEAFLGGGIVEFQTDGTLLDPSDVIFGLEVNGVVYDDKSYEINGDTLSVTIMPTGSTDSSTADFEVESNECDEIQIGVLGFTQTLIRQ